MKKIEIERMQRLEEMVARLEKEKRECLDMIERQTSEMLMLRGENRALQNIIQANIKIGDRS